MNDLEAEAAVLGSLVMGPEQNSALFGILVEACFDYPQNLAVWKALKAMDDASETIDVITLNHRLRTATGESYAARLVELMESVPSAAHGPHYARIVLEMAQRRLILEAAQNLQTSAMDVRRDTVAAIQEIQAAIERLPQNRALEPPPSFNEVLQATFDVIEAARKGQHPGFPTGIAMVDGMTGGFHRGELTLIAGRPSMGKTSFAMNAAVHLAQSGVSVAIFSMEVPRTQLAMNMMAAEARLNAQWIRKGDLNEHQLAMVHAATSRLAGLPLFIEDAMRLDISGLKARLSRVQRDHDVAVCVVDYIGLMEDGAGKTENREKEIGKISRGLKSIAMQLDVAMVVLAQLNRNPERRDGNKPHLADLRDSGTLEQDADTVLMLYRPGYYSKDQGNRAAEILIEKQRHGPTGTARAIFNMEYLRFDNPAPEDSV